MNTKTEEAGTLSMDPERLQEIVELSRQFVGDGRLQIRKVLKMSIECAFRHARFANQLVDGDRFDGALRIERARRLEELCTSFRAPLAPDFRAPGEVDFCHGSLFF